MVAVVIGEALMDVIRDRDGGETRHPGGSPANVAYGLGRLGRHAVLITQLGRDADGAAILDHLTSAGVEVRTGGEPLTRTPTAIATLGAASDATYTFDLDWNLRSAELPAAPLVVHTGSLATTVGPGAGTVEELVRAAREVSTISYDPNIRPAMIGPGRRDPRDHFERWVSVSDVVKASSEDVAYLVPGGDPLDLARRWIDLGPAIVIVTLGSAGAVAVSRRGAVRVPAFAVDVADTVGAGDSFTAGLLDALWHEDLLGGPARPRLRTIDDATLERVVRHASGAAAITVSRAGANPPTREEMMFH